MLNVSKWASEIDNDNIIKRLNYKISNKKRSVFLVKIYLNIFLGKQKFKLVDIKHCEKYFQKLK